MDKNLPYKVSLMETRKSSEIKTLRALCTDSIIKSIVEKLCHESNKNQYSDYGNGIYLKWKPLINALPLTKEMKDYIQKQQIVLEIEINLCQCRNNAPRYLPYQCFRKQKINNLFTTLRC